MLLVIMKGISCLAGLPGLGSREQEEIWNEKLGNMSMLQVIIHLYCFME